MTVVRMILDRLMYNDLYPEVELKMSNSNIGALKKKNVRNHLFVVHGIINSVINGGAKCVDIQIYDIKQAFDALWLQDCMNDLYDSLETTGRNDKLSLLYRANCDNNVAIKTPVGQTERRNIQEIVMQGGTWGPLKCSNSLDKMGKLCETNREHLYSYKNIVQIPILTMVDDTFAIAECGQKSLSINQFINTHIELKKLQMHVPDSTGKTKCHKIHVGCKNQVCPELHVHGTTMKQASEDTYLGDVIRSDGRNTSSIKNRVGRGIGSISQIISILETVSFGNYYFQIGLILREAMFLNSVLTNIEVWYGLKTCEIEELEILDRNLLCQILCLPTTTPTEFLFLETGCLNIGTIVKIRRVVYLQYLLKSDENSMLAKFFQAQFKFPVKDDWTKQVRLDLQDFCIQEDLDWIRSKSVDSFKRLVKKKAKHYALEELLKKKAIHSKLDNLEFDELEIQKYLVSGLVSANQGKTLLKFRSRMAKYDGNYGSSETPCKLCQNHADHQADIFECDFNKNKVENSDDAEDYRKLFQKEINIETIRKLETIYKRRLERLG